jgi:cell division protein ZapD
MAAEEMREQAPATESETLIFEQPLSERMRTFLRLDFLYTQALYHNEISSQWGSRAAMSSLLDVLAISTRGDIRSDVLKELERQVTVLNEFQAKPGVDTGRLKTVLANLVRLRGELLNAGSAFLQPLRDSEFLSAIKHRSAIPGGTCEFDLPDYYFWLSQPDEARVQPASRPSTSGSGCSGRCVTPSPSCSG